MFEMKDEYLTGIDQIDQEHRRLFEITQEAYELKNNEFIPDKYDNISELLHELKDYTIQHFQHEEAYMESIQYKRMFTQKIQHQAFIEKLEEFNLDHLDDDSDEMIVEILEFLTSWLVEHILENDKKIGDSN